MDIFHSCYEIRILAIVFNSAIIKEYNNSEAFESFYIQSEMHSCFLMNFSVIIVFTGCRLQSPSIQYKLFNLLTTSSNALCLRFRVIPLLIIPLFTVEFRTSAQLIMLHALTAASTIQGARRRRARQRTALSRFLCASMAKL